MEEAVVVRLQADLQKAAELLAQASERVEILEARQAKARQYLRMITDLLEVLENCLAAR